LPNSVRTRMSLSGAWHCRVQRPDYADNLPENSRRTGLGHRKHAGLFVAWHHQSIWRTCSCFVVTATCVICASVTVTCWSLSGSKCWAVSHQHRYQSSRCGSRLQLSLFSNRCFSQPHHTPRKTILGFCVHGHCKKPNCHFSSEIIRATTYLLHQLPLTFQ